MAVDAVREDNLPQASRFVRELSRKTGAVIAMTGAIDLVSDGEQCLAVQNGSPMLSRITGAGCMLSALTAAFCAVSQSPFEGAAAAVTAMGICGEIAAENCPGSGSFRVRLMDAMSCLDDSELLARGKTAKI